MRYLTTLLFITVSVLLTSVCYATNDIRHVLYDTVVVNEFRPTLAEQVYKLYEEGDYVAINNMWRDHPDHALTTFKKGTEVFVRYRSLGSNQGIYRVRAKGDPRRYYIMANRLTKSFVAKQLQTVSAKKVTKKKEVPQKDLPKPIGIDDPEDDPDIGTSTVVLKDQIVQLTKQEDCNKDKIAKILEGGGDTDGLTFYKSILAFVLLLIVVLVYILINKSD